ncbi:uncharacterized protein GIQ15_04194 [Arthroderma uncinatum]|uniref:uncharacterized protein n=1 Tax=Arthroderma uncinatum TaxID=74035 RepID=UPI00144AF0F9|nr:uncharacterized protein GIQ15_04194 [Arthroderma uncinatum]KAF3481435.1 hypothetical protein GIQ15_04194 [Arthroderma uncinatum]
MSSKSASGPDAKYELGSRLSYDGALCTVRYIGDVQDTKGQWLGVEWDEPARGKHSGAHQDVRYFQCKSKHPTAGSFVRPGRPSDKPLSFLEGAHEKYVSELPAFYSSSKGDRVIEQLMSKPIEISGKIVEELGFDEIRKQLAALNELRIIILDGLRMNGVLSGPSSPDEREKELEKIKKTCPKVVELDLSRNLLRRWCEIADICKQLPELKSLKLDGNRLEDVESCSVDIISYTVNGVSLDSTLMSWKEIALLSHKLPSLTSISLSTNELLSTTATLSTTIQELSMEFNGFESLDSLRHLTTLPSLRRLCLRSNKISKVYSSSPSELVFSPTLDFVDISRNQIPSWDFVDALQTVFPGLTGLRISDNPLYNQPPAPTKVTGLQEQPMTVDEAFMLTLSRLSNLKILNYGKVTPLDRLNGELYYLSLIRKELLAHPVSMEQDILKTHPRYKELCKVYETPEIQRTAKDNHPNAVDPRSLAAQLINFKFHLNKAKQEDDTAVSDEFEKEIPKSFDVYRIKAIVARHFSLPPLRFKLIWETDEWDPVEEGTAEEDEWDSDDEGEFQPDEPRDSKLVREASGKQFIRREEELIDSTREVSHWFPSDTMEVNPKYWCKHCKIFVRDTPYERTQHESTGKHQGSLKRFLRDVHRDQERGEKESQRAKSEVERLKGIVSNSGSSSGPKRAQNDPSWRKGTGANATGLTQDRMKQVSQLAEMGVAVPEEFRPDMALAGDWKVVSETPIDETGADTTVKNIGVRKRKLREEDQEEADIQQEVVRKAWGSAIREYPGSRTGGAGDDDSADLDALLNMTTNLKKEKKVKAEVKDEPEPSGRQEPPIKREEDDDDVGDTSAKQEDTLPNIKEEERPDLPDEAESAAPAVMFKKRKPKNIKR